MLGWISAGGRKARIAVAIALVASSACSKPPSPAVDAMPRAAASSGYAPASTVDRGPLAATRRWRIAFAPKFKLLAETGRLSGYWEPAWEGAEAEGKELGVDMELAVAPARGGSDSTYVEPQIALVERLIAARSVDGIIIGPFDSGRLAPVVDRAIAAGIPVIALDTPVSTDRIAAFVGFDNFRAGAAIGAWVAGKLGAGKRALVLSGPTDARNAIERRDGTIEALQAGGVEVLGFESGEWEVEAAREIAKKWLNEYRFFDAIVASNDNMAIGAVRALSDAERVGVLVTGFDATEEGLAALKDGRIAATVNQAPRSQGRLAVRLMVRILQGEGPLPPAIAPEEARILTARDVEARRGGAR